MSGTFDYLTFSLKETAPFCNSFHRGRFFQAYFARALGPHAVFAILAHTTLLQDGTSRIGQLRALHFADEARKMIDYCLDIGLQDATMVQTALLLVALEFQPHIHQNMTRASAALSYMETCIRFCAKLWPMATSDAEPATAAPTHAIRQEELLRMCWALSQLAASCTVWRLLSDQPVLDIPTADPTKVSNLLARAYTSSTPFSH